MHGLRVLCLATVLFAGGLSVPATAAPQGITAVGEAFAYGPPVRLVRGVALVKLEGVSPRSFLFPRDEARNKSVLAGIAERTGVSLRFERPGVFGWALYSIRDAAQDARVMPTEEQTEALVARVVADAAVHDAAVDGWRRKMATPNDAFFDQQWHFDIINATTGWDLTQGSSSQRIAIIDSGTIRSHQDLAAKDAAGYDFVSDENRSNDGDGWDAEYNDSGDGGDCGGGFEASSYHGTHVAGTAAATTNNGTGVAGVAWNAQIVTVRGLAMCGGDDFDIINGAAWAAGYQVTGVPDIAVADRANVLNMSLGGPGNCPGAWSDAVDTITDNGAFFVIASGNEGGPVDAPGNCPNVITVGAFGATGNIAGYSNTGPEVEIYGPGGDNNGGVASTIGPDNNGYTFQVGTSMATPHVAGVISLMLDVNPGLDYNGIVSTFDQGVTCTGCDGVPALQMDLMIAAAGGVVIEPEPEPTPTGDDVYEENDTFDTATPLPCDSTFGNLHAGPQDFDFFSVSQPAGVDFTVTLNTDANTDLDLYVVKGMAFPDDILAAAETPSGNETLSYTSTGTDVAVLVNPWFDEQSGDTNDGDYGLTITCTGDVVEPEPSPEPEPTVGEPEPTPEPEGPTGMTDPNEVDKYEPNDEPSTATLLECGEEFELSLHDDQDWFIVPVSDGATLQVTSEGFTDDVAFEIRNSDGSLVVVESAPGIDDGLQFASLEKLSAGSYAVVAKPGSENQLYALRTYCLDPDEDDAPLCSHTGLGDAAVHGVWLWGGLLWMAGRRRRR